MGDHFEVIKAAQDIFDNEIDALRKTRDSLGEDFEILVDLVLHCKGKVVLTGMGKPGHIGTKIAATLASLGTPSFFMHPAEAMHGDLGMVSANDVVIAISFSGESDEIVRILPNIGTIAQDADTSAPGVHCASRTRFDIIISLAAGKAIGTWDI